MSGSHFFTRTLGKSAEGRDVIVQANFDTNSPPPRNFILLIGGQHGDEPATIRAIESFATPICPPDSTAVHRHHRARQSRRVCRAHALQCAWCRSQPQLRL